MNSYTNHNHKHFASVFYHFIFFFFWGGGIGHLLGKEAYFSSLFLFFSFFLLLVSFIFYFEKSLELRNHKKKKMNGILLEVLSAILSNSYTNFYSRQSESLLVTKYMTFIILLSKILLNILQSSHQKVDCSMPYESGD